MMKIGEAAKRLAQQEVLAPAGVDWALTVANRNFIIHQYDEINRHTKGPSSRMVMKVSTAAAALEQDRTPSP